MDLELHVVNHLNHAVDRDVAVALTAAGITLGRHAGNDLVLDDPERVVSGRHARLDLRNGAVWLTDTSRNGTFLNLGSEPLSPHEAVALHDGDCLTIGSYEIRVRIPDAIAPWREEPAGVADGAALPGLEKRGAATDILDLLGASAQHPLEGLGAPADPSLSDDPFADAAALDDALAGIAPESPQREPLPRHTPVEHVFFRPEQAQAVPEDYDLLNDRLAPLEAGVAESDSPGTDAVLEPPPVHRDPPSAPEDRSPRPERERPRRPEPSRLANAPDVRSGGGELVAFLSGLGVGEASDVRQPEVLLRQAGALLRALATGLTRTLMGRAHFKSELRLGMTTIRAADNNPFKFSAGTDDLIDRLLFRPSAGFMTGPQAAQEAFEDIQAHEMAMTAGLQAALRAVLSRFDPDELAQPLGEPSGLDHLLRKGRKAKCWDLFTETYERVSAEASEDIMQLFGGAFADAYQDQLEQLRRSRRAVPE